MKRTVLIELLALASLATPLASGQIVPRNPGVPEMPPQPRNLQVLLDDHGSQAGFKRIFNGVDLTGWTGNPKLWSVRDAAITGQTTAENPAPGNTFLIWTNGALSDFELRCSFRIVPGDSQGFANSGIQYRSKVLDPKNWVVGGYQADMEAGPTYTGSLYEERMTRGTMAARGEKVVWDKNCQKHVVGGVGDAGAIQASLKKGGWNTYRIIARGNHLQQFINGQMSVDVTDNCKSKHAMSGVLALQLHAGPPMLVQFKNLRLKDLSDRGGTLPDDLKKLQGAWRVGGAEANGSAIDQSDIPNLSVTIKGNSYSLLNGDQTDKGTFSLDPSKTPKQMDIHHTNGYGDAETLLAIYEIQPDGFRVCYAQPGGERPTSFTSTQDSGTILVTYKRK
jgi:uncharacterized protein (TIGR03067 family)